MMAWVLQHVPIEVLFVVGAVLVFVIHRYFGLRAAAGAAIVAFLMLMNANARKQGWNAREEKGRKDADRAIEEADDARRDALVRDSNPDRLRESDGYRRD